MAHVYHRPRAADRACAKYPDTALGRTLGRDRACAPTLRRRSMTAPRPRCGYDDGMRIPMILCAAALAACAPTEAKTADDYSVSLSSVNLGEDCWTPPAPVSPAPMTPAKPEKERAAAPADMAPPRPGFVRHCDQTSM